MGPGGGLAGLEADSGVKALRKVTLGAGSVVVDPPPGYCIDSASVSSRPGAGFALIASCEALTGRFDGLDVDPAVITVSVVPARGDGSQPAAASLSARLDGAVPVTEINGDGLTIVHVDGGEARPGTADTRHWRAALIVNGSLVGLALYGAQGSPVAGAGGEALLVTLAERIRDNSPKASASDVSLRSVDSAATTVPQEAQESETGEPAGLWRRLFPR